MLKSRIVDGWRGRLGDALATAPAAAAATGNGDEALASAACSKTKATKSRLVLLHFVCYTLHFAQGDSALICERCKHREAHSRHVPGTLGRIGRGEQEGLAGLDAERALPV